MMQVILLLILFWAAPVEAVTRYVIPSASGTGCSNGSTNFDPSTGNCGAGSDTVYFGANAATPINGGSAGDITEYFTGVYTTGVNVTATGTNFDSGARTIRCRQAHTCSLAVSGSQHFAFNSGANYYTILHGFTMDGTNILDQQVYIGSSGFVRVRNNTLINNEVGIGIFANRNSHHFEIIANEIGTGAFVCGGCGGGGSYSYPLYIEGSDGLIERNTIHDAPSYGIHQYSGWPEKPNRNVIRYNVIYNIGTAGGIAAGILVGTGDSTLAHDNVIRDSAGAGVSGIAISNGATNARVYNNTIRNQGFAGISWGQQSGGIIRNNILWQNGSDWHDYNGTTVTRSNNLCASGGSPCSVTTDPLFVAPGSANLSLQNGSPAIDAGTASIATGITLTCAGVCDIGAFEVPKLSACSAVDNTLSLVFDNPRFPPLSNLSVAGITGTIDGTGRTLSSPTLIGTNQVNMSFSGAAVSATAASVGASGTLAITDSALIGNSNNQVVGSWSSTPCTVTPAGGLTLTQKYFRIHDLPGSESSPKCLSGSGSCTSMQNVNASIQQGGCFRCRVKVACTGADCGSVGLAWRYSKNAGGYTLAPDAYDSDNFRFFGTADTSSEIPAQGTQTTELLTSDHATNKTGAVVRTSAAIPNVVFTQDSETEIEGMFCIDSDETIGTTYDLRLYDQNGTALTAYTVTPRVTVASPALAGFGL